MDNNTKPFKLLACDIENERINESYSELYDKLKTKLEDKTPAEKRRLQLNTTSQEEDLLSDFAISPKNDYIYGVMFRISPAKEAPSIPADFFKQERIQIDEIQEKEQNANIVCKDHYYFFLNKNFLVTTQPKSKIRSFQTYLNWFLESLKTNDVYYKFAPKIKSM